jgi:nitric-oxide synthase
VERLALVKLHVAVLHSYKKYSVRILDHHALTASFMQLVDDEQQCGRHVYGDRLIADSKKNDF